MIYLKFKSFERYTLSNFHNFQLRSFTIYEKIEQILIKILKLCFALKSNVNKIRDLGYRGGFRSVQFSE